MTYNVWEISWYGPTVDNKNICIFVLCIAFIFLFFYLKSRRAKGAASRAMVLPIVAAPLHPSYSQVSQNDVTSLGPLEELGQEVL